MKCIKCGQEMVNISGGNYRCPSCGQTINDLVYRGEATIPFRPNNYQIATHCVICGKEVILDTTAPIILGQITVCDDCKKSNRLGERLCQLEDKIENGTLIELPCKVGTTIYHLYKASNVITEDKVFNYHFEICSKPCVSFENHFWYGTKKRVDTILVEHFGKYWFTDKAKAEAKVRELKEKNNEFWLWSWVSYLKLIDSDSNIDNPF